MRGRERKSARYIEKEKASVVDGGRERESVLGRECEKERHARTWVCREETSASVESTLVCIRARLPRLVAARVLDGILRNDQTGE